MKKSELGEFVSSTTFENELDKKNFEKYFEIVPKMGRHWNIHSLLFLKRQSLSRILFLNEIYQQIVDVPGYIFEFGVQWGTTLNILMQLRGIYEPYNYSRKIIGFDTFLGFVDVEKIDGDTSSVGDYRTYKGYETDLSQILSLQESMSPINHIKKFELVKGDVVETLPSWFDKNREAVVSLAFFDMDLYKPTKSALTHVLERCVKGSILVFDEFCCDKFPGETVAVFETLDRQRLKRVPNMPFCSYCVVE